MLIIGLLISVAAALIISVAFSVLFIAAIVALIQLVKLVSERGRFKALKLWVKERNGSVTPYVITVSGEKQKIFKADVKGNSYSPSSVPDEIVQALELAEANDSWIQTQADGRRPAVLLDDQTIDKAKSENPDEFQNI